MSKKKESSSPGLSVIGGFIVGVVAFLAALLAIINEFDYVGAGVLLIAAALAFGLNANAMFRK